MNTVAIRAVRVLAPHDVRLVWRDGFFLSFLVVVVPFACLGLQWLVPHVAGLVVEWVDLRPYYGLILANLLVAGEPVLLGFVVGVLLVEERDRGTLLALQTSPLTLRGFLGYRILGAMGLSVLLTAIGVRLADLVSVSWLALLASAALASLAVPLVALVYAIYVRNKVQALLMLKPLQLWGGAPTLLFFVSPPWQWVGSAFGPLYYPMRLFWGATEGQTEWWLLGPGMLIPGLALIWLLRRCERDILA